VLKNEEITVAERSYWNETKWDLGRMGMESILLGTGKCFTEKASCSNFLVTAGSHFL
jgi:hypothetical protein